MTTGAVVGAGGFSASSTDSCILTATEFLKFSSSFRASFLSARTSTLAARLGTTAARRAADGLARCVL
jgi:hypothetical protein